MLDLLVVLRPFESLLPVLRLEHLSVAKWDLDRDSFERRVKQWEEICVLIVEISQTHSHTGFTLRRNASLGTHGNSCRKAFLHLADGRGNTSQL